MISTFWVALILLLGTLNLAHSKITNVVLFGDSYTGELITYIASFVSPPDFFQISKLNFFRKRITHLF